MYVIYVASHLITKSTLAYCFFTEARERIFSPSADGRERADREGLNPHGTRLSYVGALERSRRLLLWRILHKTYIFANIPHWVIYLVILSTTQLTAD